MTAPPTPRPVPGAAVEAGRRARAAPVPAVDSCTVLSASDVTARKLVRADDPYMEGHYPDVTIYPGAFLLESVYQAVLHLVWETRGTGSFAVPARIDSVRFLAAFGPGDVLDIRCACTPSGPDGLDVTAECRKGETRAAKVSMSFRIVPAADQEVTDA
ncbi:3-hydroxyacyl-ACP dehydratase FabZ family protein [Streptomyces sp. NPDC048416]|uniref:3-hydroxyacyl-ACP dehydratase FabZ family protein n=1 Tax=Streptomyces sp. NPDC048416 TaxID=3365546 RepID=UPI00370FCBC0